jgi:hydroxyethylthiazole kinase
MNPSVIQKVRENSPLVHHLTNKVVMNFTANGLLSFGAIPVMADAPEEAREMSLHADAVLINMGTLGQSEITAMIAAGKAANEKGIPIVLDPVGVAATPFRTDAVKRILHEVKPTVIKGNAGEMAHLVQIPWKTKGPDSIGKGNTAELAAKVAKTYQTAAVVTGNVDVFCSNDHLMQNKTGHPLLTKITGAGCLLGSILAACLTTNHTLEQQVMTALTFYGHAAEYAANHLDVYGSGTFLPHFIDALSFDTDKLVIDDK